MRMAMGDKGVWIVFAVLLRHPSLRIPKRERKKAINFFFISSNCTHVQQDLHFHNHVYSIESIFEVIHFHTFCYSRKGENIIHCLLTTVRKEIS